MPQHERRIYIRRDEFIAFDVARARPALFHFAAQRAASARYRSAMANERAPPHRADAG